MAVVVDTSFLVDLSRAKKTALEAWRSLVERGEKLFLPSPVLLEYLAGSARPEVDQELLRQATDPLPFGEAEALAAAAIARRALRDGNFPGWMDIIIAGVAKEHGDLAIVTAKPAHFPYSKAVSY